MIHYKQGPVTVFRSALYQMTSTIIITEESAIIIDPGILPQEVEMIQTFIEDEAPGYDLFIIYTHNDFDHLVGAGAFPHAQVIVSQAFAQEKNPQLVIETIEQFDQHYYLDRPYAHQYPKANIIIEQDGQQLTIGSLTMTFYLAPGHTSDSMFIMIEPLKLLISGDYFSDVEFPFINSNYRDYVQTLNKANFLLIEYGIETLIPGHGSVAQGSLAASLRLKESQAYLASLFEELPAGELEEELQEQYRFYMGMETEHYHNKEVVETELPGLSQLETDEHVTIIPYDAKYSAETVRMWRESKESAINQKEKHSFNHHVNFINNILSQKYKIELALIGQRVVGLIAYNDQEISQLYIHVDHQNKRIGQLLLDRAKAQSAGKLTLYTFEVNKQARRFYEKNGFRMIAQEDSSENEENLPAILFEWKETSKAY